MCVHEKAKTKGRDVGAELSSENNPRRRSAHEHEVLISHPFFHSVVSYVLLCISTLPSAVVNDTKVLLLS